MVSLKQDRAGDRLRWRLTFYGLNRKRFRVWFGDISKSRQRELNHHIARIERAGKLGDELEEATIKWLTTIDKDLYDKLVEAELLKPRKSGELAAVIDGYIELRADACERTTTNWMNSRRKLTDHFGTSRQVNSITVGDADMWRQALVTTNKTSGDKLPYSVASISKAVKHAKQFFRFAVRQGLISKNPFLSLVAGGEVNKDRDFFVTREMTRRMMDVCLNHESRLLLALCRFGGLRCDSETHNLRWRDVNLDADEMIVHSPKTKKHKPYRVVPIYPELRPYLADSRSEAISNGATLDDFVLPARTRSAAYSQFLKLRKKANVEAYPRLFHNLRKSRQTELLDAKFSIQNVCEWMGNDQSTALLHYLQTTEQHRSRAKLEPTGFWGDVGGTIGGMHSQAPDGNAERDSQDIPRNMEELPSPATNRPLLPTHEISVNLNEYPQGD